MDESENDTMLSSPSKKLMADMDFAVALTVFETIFALHDAGVIDKKVVADRLRKLAARKDVKMNSTVREVLIINAKGIDAAGESDDE